MDNKNTEESNRKELPADEDVASICEESVLESCRNAKTAMFDQFSTVDWLSKSRGISSRCLKEAMEALKSVGKVVPLEDMIHQLQPCPEDRCWSICDEVFRHWGQLYRKFFARSNEAIRPSTPFETQMYVMPQLIQEFGYEIYKIQMQKHVGVETTRLTRLKSEIQDFLCDDTSISLTLILLQNTGRCVIQEAYNEMKYTTFIRDLSCFQKTSANQINKLELEENLTEVESSINKLVTKIEIYTNEAKQASQEGKEEQVAMLLSHRERLQLKLERANKEFSVTINLINAVEHSEAMVKMEKAVNNVASGLDQNDSVDVSLNLQQMKRDFLPAVPRTIDNTELRREFKRLLSTDHRADAKRQCLGRPFLICAGGRGTSGNPMQSVECYDVTNHHWFRVSEMSTPRSHVGVVTVGGKLFVVGGFSGTEHLKTGEVYDWETNTWKHISPMSKPRSALALSSLNGHIYAVGGCDDKSCFNSVDWYDPESDSWSVAQPLNYARCGVAAVTCKFIMYAIGGNDGTAYLESCESFDLHSNKWTVTSPMNTKRADAGVAELNGYLYVVGGFDGHFLLNCVERFDPVDKVWSTIVDLPSPRSGVGVVAVSGKLYTVGGYDGTYLSSVDTFDPETICWNHISNSGAHVADAGVVSILWHRDDLESKQPSSTSEISDI